jgi:hypothetical protein
VKDASDECNRMSWSRAWNFGKGGGEGGPMQNERDADAGGTSNGTGRT